MLHTLEQLHRKTVEAGPLMCHTAWFAKLGESLFLAEKLWALHICAQYLGGSIPFVFPLKLEDLRKKTLWLAHYN